MWKHLVNRIFTPHYYIWFQHGEGYNHGNESSSSNSNFQDEPVNHLHNENSYHQEEQMVDYDRVHDMVVDLFVADEVEESNIDVKMFCEMLAAAN